MQSAETERELFLIPTVVYEHNIFTVALGKGLNLCSNLCLFATHLKLNFILRSFAATFTLMFAHAHLYNLNVLLIMWACSRNVEAMLLSACLISQSSDAKFK